jgi:hypothetical protein
VDTSVVLELLESLPHLLKLPSKQIWFDFDEVGVTILNARKRLAGRT